MNDTPTNTDRGGNGHLRRSVYFIFLLLNNWNDFSLRATKMRLNENIVKSIYTHWAVDWNVCVDLFRFYFPIMWCKWICVVLLNVLLCPFDRICAESARVHTRISVLSTFSLSKISLFTIDKKKVMYFIVAV